jgi:putative tryptophan/tyrosine transport system substrate-binding protein
MMNRRLLIIALAGAAMLDAEKQVHAEKAKSFTIAYLALLPGEDRTSFLEAFVRRLNELGYVDGRNLRLIYRSADGRPELLPSLASELVTMKPDVLVTGFGTVAAKAAKAATGGIPVLFMAVGDPVGAGVVESLARPGGNVTGLSDLAAHLQGSRLQLLHEIAPGASLIAVVLNPGTPYTALAYKELQEAAKVVDVQLRPLQVRLPEEIAPQLEAGKAAGAGGVVVLEDPLTFSQRSKLRWASPACNFLPSMAIASSRRQAASCLTGPTTTRVGGVVRRLSISFSKAQGRPTSRSSSRPSSSLWSI